MARMLAAKPSVSPMGVEHPSLRAAIASRQGRGSYFWIGCGRSGSERVHEWMDRSGSGRVPAEEASVPVQAAVQCIERVPAPWGGRD